MVKKYYEQLFILLYCVVILIFLFEIFKSGFANIRMYQVILLGVLAVSLVDRLRTFLKTKKKQ